VGVVLCYEINVFLNECGKVLETVMDRISLMGPMHNVDVVMLNGA